MTKTKRKPQTPVRSTRLVRLRSDQFVAYVGHRGGRTIATVTSIWRLPNNPHWYGSMTLSRRNNGVKYCNGIIPSRLAMRNRSLWRRRYRLNTKLSGGGPLSNKTTEAESRRPRSDRFGDNMKTPEDWAAAIGKVTNTSRKHQSDLNVMVQEIQAEARPQKVFVLHMGQGHDIGAAVGWTASWEFACAWAEKKKGSYEPLSEVSPNK